MKYALVITTDGRPDLLANTIGSFLPRFRPKPQSCHVVDDSGNPDYTRYLRDLLPRYFGSRWEIVAHSRRAGFCETVADAWALAVGSGEPLVWWTEDDFIYQRSADLNDLAFVLQGERKLAQMGLMRQAVNEREIAGGGLFKLNRKQYERRGSGGVAWLRSRTNFSTTASLMRRDFMALNPWPADEKECEGQFSVGLLAKGYEFGVWGTGEPWVEHVGVRVGSGY